MAALLLILIGVLAMACHGLGLSANRIHLGWLGFAFVAAGVWLVPVWSAVA